MADTFTSIHTGETIDSAVSRALTVPALASNDVGVMYTTGSSYLIKTPGSLTLEGYTSPTSSIGYRDIAATDSINGAFQKLQGQIGSIVDSSLTTQGRAADAYETGIRFVAVDDEVHELEDDFQQLKGLATSSQIGGDNVVSNYYYRYRIPVSGSSLEYTGTAWRCYYVSVSPNDVYQISCRASDNFAAYAFGATGSNDLISTYPSIGTSGAYEIVNRFVTIPSGVSSLFVDFYSPANDPSPFSVSIKKVILNDTSVITLHGYNAPSTANQNEVTSSDTINEAIQKLQAQIAYLKSRI